MTSTIEEQIRTIDKVLKECDGSRKNLENLTRKLDDLYDEVRRYRDFLNYEKGRREPTASAGYKNRERSNQNEHICSTLSQLTEHLSQEWVDKLSTLASNLSGHSSVSGSQSARINNS